MPLHVSRPGPVVRLFSSRGGDPLPSSPCLAWGRSPPCLRACPCELALRAVGAARGRPGRGAPCLGVERPGLGALPGPTARPWGVRPGPATHRLWVRGSWAWGPIANPTARTPASWLCVLWGRHNDTRGGGGLLPVCWVVGVGRSPTPDCPFLLRTAGARYPVALRAGGVGVATRHEPHSARSCTLWGRHEGL